MRIKIFESDNRLKLENEVNDFLSKHSLAENFKDIKITSTYNGYCEKYIIMVVM